MKTKDGVSLLGVRPHKKNKLLRRGGVLHVCRFLDGRLYKLELEK